MQTQRLNGWVTVLLIVLVGGALPVARAADQWWDTATNSGLTAGSAAWDTGVTAWASSSSPGTNAPAFWTNGNNAWFTTSGGSTVTVNGVTVGQLAATAGGSLMLARGSGPLTINGDAICANAGTVHLLSDVNQASNGTWMVQNATLNVTGQLTGASATLTKAGYSAMNIYGTTNTLGGFTIRNGSVIAFNGGSPLGTGPLRLGIQVPPGSTLAGVNESLATGGAAVLTLAAGSVNQTTTLGDLTVPALAQLTINAPAVGVTNTVQAGALTRSGSGLLLVSGANNWASRVRLSFTGGTDLVNGILPPWIAENYSAGADFMTYTATGGLAVATYAGSFNPGLTNQVVNITAAANLSAAQTSYAVRVYGANINLNGNDLVIGDGTLGGLAIWGTSFTNASGTGTLRLNGNDTFVCLGLGSSRFFVPMAGTGLMNVAGGAGSSLTISNATLYPGSTSIGGWANSASTLYLHPTADVSLDRSLTANPLGTIQKNGPYTLTLTGTNMVFPGASFTVSSGTVACVGNTVNLYGTLNVSGGTVSMNGVSGSNNATLNIGGLGTSLAITNGSLMRGAFTVNVGPAAGNNGNTFTVADATVGTSASTPTWTVGGAAGASGNQMVLTRVQLSSGALTVGNQTSNNTVTVNGTNTVWNFNGSAVKVGTGHGANGNTMVVDGGSLAGGVVLTNIATLNVNDLGGNTKTNANNTLILTNGVCAYVAGGIYVSQLTGGNGSCLTTNGVLRIDGGSAGATLINGSVLTFGGTKTDASSYGNEFSLANAVLRCAGVCSLIGPGTVRVLTNATWVCGGAAIGDSISISNLVMTVDGGVITNTGKLNVNGKNQSITLANGAKWYFVTGNGNGSSMGTTAGDARNTITITSGSLWADMSGYAFGIGGTGATGNQMIVNGGTYSNQAAMNIGGNANNGILVTNGIVYSSGALSIGGAGNFVTVQNAGTATYAGGITVGSAGGNTGNTLTVQSGGSLIATNSTIGSSCSNNSATVAGVWNLGGSLTIGNGLSSGNTVTLDGGTLTNVGGSIYLGSVSSANSSSGNQLILTNGAKVYSGSANRLGPLSSGSGGAYSASNLVVVTGRGTWWNAGNQLIDVGYAYTGASSGNVLRVEGGAVIANVAAVTVGNIGNAAAIASSGNQLLLSNGGQLYAASATAGGVNGAAKGTTNLISVTSGALLEVGSAGLVAGAADGNLITNSGGIFQFNGTATPTITPNGQGRIALDNGVISFRNIATVNVTNNWRGSQLTNITFSGVNAFRLDNATNGVAASQSQTYVFDGSTPTNYVGLDMVNGGTAYTNGSITIGSASATNSWLLFSNTTAVIWGTVTNYGKLINYNSTVTFMRDLRLAEGSRLYVGTNGVNVGMTVNGTLTLPASASISFATPIGANDTITLFTSPNTIVGSVAGWTSPGSHLISKSANQLVLRPRLPGFVFMVD